MVACPAHNELLVAHATATAEYDHKNRSSASPRRLIHGALPPGSFRNDCRPGYGQFLTAVRRHAYEEAPEQVRGGGSRRVGQLEPTSKLITRMRVDGAVQVNSNQLNCDAFDHKTE